MQVLSCLVEKLSTKNNPFSLQSLKNILLNIITHGGIEEKTHVALCSRLKEEMLHPMRVTITSRVAPDAELVSWLLILLSYLERESY